MQLPILFAHGQQGLLSLMAIAILGGLGGLFCLGAALAFLTRKTEEGRRVASRLFVAMIVCFGVALLSPLIIQIFHLP